LQTAILEALAEMAEARQEEVLALDAKLTADGRADLVVGEATYTLTREMVAFIRCVTLGGVLGAVTGGNVGNSSAACEQTKTYTRQAENRYYGNRGRVEVYSTEIYRDYTPYPRHRDRHHHDNDGWDIDRDVSERSVKDRCTLAESPIYMPDGRIQKRFVRVCPDDRGRYQVVQ
jgi:hypothetical protein